MEEIDIVYCSKCGKQMDDSSTFCSGCGAPLQNQINYAVPDINKSRKPGFGVAALVLIFWLRVLQQDFVRMDSGAEWLR